MIKYEPFKEYFAEDLKVFEKEAEIKEKFTEIATFYLESHDSRDVIDHLRDLNHSEIVRPWFIRNAILVACGKGNKEREKTSQLLKELSKELKINFAMFSYAFDHCIENIQDYQLDIPNFAEYLAMFIARAIYDECFNAMYILHAEVYDSENEAQLKVLKSACAYLSLEPMADYMVHIWGSAITNDELCHKFDELTLSFQEGEKDTDVCAKLKDLDCKFFYHEFIKRLVLHYVYLDTSPEIDYDRIIKFINHMLNLDILSKSQLEVGVKNAKRCIHEDKGNLAAHENLQKMNEH